MIVDDIALPATRFAGLTERAFRERRSTDLPAVSGAIRAFGRDVRERVRALPAHGGIAALLGVAIATPLLEIRRVAFTYRDSPVEYRVSLVNTARHEYWAEIGG